MKLFEIGVRPDESPQQFRRIAILNRIILFFLVLSVPITISLFIIEGVPLKMAGYFSCQTGAFVFLLYANSRRWFDFTAFFLVFVGDLATISVPILLGTEVQAQFMLMIIAGLPFLVFDRSWGMKRALMATFVLPCWLGMELYLAHFPPIFQLDPYIIKMSGYFYAVVVLVWSVYIFYNFTTLNEQFAQRIRSQRDELDARNKRLEQYGYTATHDLKTPIANIEGFHSLLESDLENPSEDVKLSMNGISQSIAQANKIIFDLLEIAKLTSVIEELEIVNLNEVVSDIKQSLNQRIKDSEADLIVDFTDCPTIRFGKMGLKSILQNLITNALKYRSPNRKPVISISSHLKGEYAVLEVEDNGLGIDLETQGDKLFGMFKRIHTNEEGSGVGLYVIKNLIEDRGGRIEVQSVPDKGTKFKVYLPLNIIS